MPLEAIQARHFAPTFAVGVIWRAFCVVRANFRRKEQGVMKTVRGSKRVFIVLTDALLERIDRQAKEKTMSRSLIVRLACDKFLRDLEEGKEVTA